MSRAEMVLENLEELDFTQSYLWNSMELCQGALLYREII